MSVAIVTGSAGLIGSEAVKFLIAKGVDVIGIDNDMRSYFFGAKASTIENVEKLKLSYENYKHYDCDIRDTESVENIFNEYSSDIKYIIHSAAQPSHDWAAREPKTDFLINSKATLDILELTRKYSAKASFCFMSTNKVYGDTPNQLPLIELENRWEIEVGHKYYDGIDESMSIDQTTHSLFGASKLSADIITQEYGRYFGMNTGVFRGGCLTGRQHAGAELHGFLAYLVKCVISNIPYRIFGYNGKQVRDNIHSYDLVSALWQFCENPRCGEVYNIGGSRHSNCSMLEAIKLIESLTDKKLNYEYVEKNRIGDHIWWISDVNKFRQHYPGWAYQYNLTDIFEQIIAGELEK